MDHLTRWASLHPCTQTSLSRVGRRILDEGEALNLNEIQTEGDQDWHTWDWIGGPKSDMGCGNGQDKASGGDWINLIEIGIEVPKILITQEKYFSGTCGHA